LKQEVRRTDRIAKAGMRGSEEVVSSALQLAWYVFTWLSCKKTHLLVADASHTCRYHF